MSRGKMQFVKIEEILKRLKQLKGLKTDTELAQYLGVKQNTISSWKRRRTIPYNLFISKCEEEKINLNWLLTGQGEMFMKPAKLEFKHMTTEEILKQFPQAIPAHPVPVINIQVPAGFPEMPLDKEQIIDYLYLPDIPKGSMAIRIKGASMEPTIEDSDYVVFLPLDKLQEPIKSGDVVIIQNEWNELILKRYREKDGKIYLTSDNPKYPTIEPNECYKIVGKVIRRVKEERF
ncbi:MAG: helix-turn-helix transcriptional regulator [Candidatus Marinimicrobia bacterium]|nr:helix-turn-helix transcriptional regulator [Candidatus Neomarinimicrobiota bacterium]